MEERGKLGLRFVPLLGALFVVLLVVGTSLQAIRPTMVDFGVAQNPMFFEGEPQDWASPLPGWGPTRVLVDGAFSGSFEATGPLLVGLGWLLALAVGMALLLRRAVGMRG